MMISPYNILLAIFSLAVPAIFVLAILFYIGISMVGMCDFFAILIAMWIALAVIIFGMLKFIGAEKTIYIGGKDNG